jgi:hypothetical protein
MVVRPRDTVRLLLRSADFEPGFSNCPRGVFCFESPGVGMNYFVFYEPNGSALHLLIAPDSSNMDCRSYYLLDIK